MAEASKPNLPEEPFGVDWTFCRQCDQSFHTWAAFHNHKIRSALHIVCHTCSKDFKSYEGLKLHRLQDHAHEQDLNCSYCGKRFNRAGALVGHVELEGCPMKPSEESFVAGVRQKTERYQNYQEARNFQEYGRAAGDFSFEYVQSLVPFR
jgi:DNA-directed RNA polymerase subunit RPC12/RpoP